MAAAARQLVSHGPWKGGITRIASRRVILCGGQRLYATEQKKNESESEPKKDKDSFKGQLYQSTQERVIREREEQARFTRYREAEKAAKGGAPWVIPLGKNTIHKFMKNCKEFTF